MRPIVLAAHGALLATLVVACASHSDDAGSPGGISSETRYTAGSSAVDSNVVASTATADARMLRMHQSLHVVRTPPALRTLSASAIAAESYGSDAGAGEQGDAGLCADFNPSSYDRTCKSSDDCVAVVLGHVCSAECQCANDAINKTAQRAYDDALIPILVQGFCNCPAQTAPCCSQGQCSMSCP